MGTSRNFIRTAATIGKDLGRDVLYCDVVMTVGDAVVDCDDRGIIDLTSRSGNEAGCQVMRSGFSARR
jgi:hypothetical protein